ncbi:MAG: hypothetical protein V4536_01125 [Pseudomonadota bacterium]
MKLIYLATTFCISIRNFFSDKQFHVELVGEVILISRRNPEIVIHDYYFYILGLLRCSLHALSKNCFVFYEVNSFRFLNVFLPILHVNLQIEHTLVKPGGRDASGSLSGSLLIPNSSMRYLVRIANLPRLSIANAVFDYSRINLYNIRSAKVLDWYLRKTFCISPALYPLNIDTLGRDGVITLFGNPEDSRRKLFLEDLKKRQIHSVNVRGVYFDIDLIYRKTRIVINIRQTEYHDTLEELRVLPALRSGAIVICESTPYAEKTWYSKFIIWGSLERIPDLIIHTQRNYNEIHHQIFGDEFHSPFLRRMRRIERCNKLASIRAANRLNQDLLGF